MGMQTRHLMIVVAGDSSGCALRLWRVQEMSREGRQLVHSFNLGGGHEVVGMRWWGAWHVHLARAVVGAMWWLGSRWQVGGGKVTLICSFRITTVVNSSNIALLI